MRPFLEKMPYDPSSSVSWLNRRLQDGIPFQWHHHPEYELTMTLNSRGQRFIGDHVDAYDDCDLVLVGANLPHTWVSQSRIDQQIPHVALVIKFHPDWAANITQNFVEFGAFKALLGRAGRGLKFSNDMAQSVRAHYEALFDLPAPERLLALLRILTDLAGDTQASVLSSRAASRESGAENRIRIDRVLDHIHVHYKRALPMEELGEVAALSVSGLHRLFKKHTQSNVSQYVTQMRVGDACAQLSGTDKPVGYIAEEVGYSSIANFNRQFLRLKGMTPRAYRAHFRA
jgi:AraC-like DNA-binding protein